MDFQKTFHSTSHGPLPKKTRLDFLQMYTYGSRDAGAQRVPNCKVIPNARRGLSPPGEECPDGVAGSLFVPLLYIYDLDRGLMNPCFKFEDDVRIVSVANQETVQADLNTLYQ